MGYRLSTESARAPPKLDRMQKATGALKSLADRIHIPSYGTCMSPSLAFVREGVGRAVRL